MLKMSGFDVLFAAAGNLYLLLALACICFALWMGKTWTRKLLYAAAVLALSVAPIAPKIYRTIEYRAKLAKAQALFDERCKTSGEKIFKKAEGVDSVSLLNVRSRGISASVLRDPDWLDAALPHEPGQDGYIMTFLLWEQYQDKRNDRGYLNNRSSDRPGFKFVDVFESNGSIYRYRLILPDAREMSRELLSGKASRFAVSFINMTEPTDRQFWVAGTKVTITDTATREVMAEKVWWAIEPGQGDTSGERSPWAFARQCPSHIGWNGASTRFFVDQVLTPSKDK